MSSRRLQDMSSRRPQDMSSRQFQDMSSRHLETSLQESVPADCLLITLDIKSLYTNIPNNQDIKAGWEAYNNHQLKS